MKIKLRKTARLAILLSVFVLSSVMNMQSKAVNITMQTSSQQVNNIIEKKGKSNLEKFQTTRFIVKYKNDDGLAQLKEGIKDKVKSSKEIKDKHFSIVNTEQRMKVSDLVDEIKQKKLDSNIEYIQPDYSLTLSSNDTHFDKQWGIYNDKTVIATDISGKEQSIKFDINAVDAWKYSQGKDTVVAVLDTGIDINHEDLKANIFVNDKEIPGNGVDDDGNGYIDDVNGWNFIDDNNKVHDQDKANDELHGTHVAGIVGAAGNNGTGIIGVAPKAEILPLKVFSNGSAFTSDIIAAIDYASKMGVKIVNCSWGSNKDNPALEDAISNSDMLFVCAAGNDQSDLDINPIYPASYDSDNVIAVASMSQTGMLSAFSNYGELSVDVAAPGENIISTIPDNSYQRLSGTSMSAAFVSGEAALIFSQNQELDIKETKLRIINSSSRLTTLLQKISKGSMINAGNALKNNFPDENSLLNIQKSSNTTNMETSISTSGYNLFSVAGTWESIANMPDPREGRGITTVNGKIYVIGSDYGSSTKIVYEYNPVSNTWINKFTLSIQSNSVGVAAVNNKIYIIGIHSTASSGSVYEYDPVNNTIIQKASMPSGKGGFGTAVVNGLIYAIGGYDSAAAATTTSVLIYNPQNNTWTTGASMKTSRYSLGTAVVDGKIYAIGGYSDTWSPYNTVEIYDPSTNIWSSKAGMPTSRGDLGCTAVNGKIYAIGGNTYDEEDSMNIVEEYDPITNLWSRDTNMSEYRSRPGVTNINNTIYVIGGITCDYSYLSSGEKFTINSNNDDYGNDFSTAWILQPSSINSGTIETAGDVDFFRFVPTVSGYYSIQTTGSTDTYGYLYDVNQKLIVQNDDSNDLNFCMWNYLNSGQTYYIKVCHYSSSGTGSYVLKLFNDDTGNAFNVTKALTAGNQVQGKIDYAGDEDYYSFTPTVTGSYSIISTGSTDTYAYLYNSSRGLIKSNDNDMDTNFYIFATLTANQIYYIKVRHNLSTSIGNYGLVIQADDVGNSFSNTRNISESTENIEKIDYAGDVDYYAITPLTNSYYTIVTTGNTNTYGYLYDSNRNQLAFNDDYNDSNFCIEYQLTANQTYYIKVKHSLSNSTGTYSLWVKPSSSYTTSKSDFTLYLTASHIKDFSSSSFTLTYNPNELDIVDLCGATQQKELDAASLLNTNIKLKTFTPGKIIFTLDTPIASGKEWSGLVNTVKFKSKVSYDTQVIYTVQ